MSEKLSRQWILKFDKLHNMCITEVSFLLSTPDKIHAKNTHAPKYTSNVKTWKKNVLPILKRFVKNWVFFHVFRLQVKMLSIYAMHVFVLQTSRKYVFFFNYYENNNNQKIVKRTNHLSYETRPMWSKICISQNLLCLKNLRTMRAMWIVIFF